MEDPFDRFAAECRLTVSAEAIYHAPYDIAEPLSEAEQPYLVTVESRSAGPGMALRLVFLVSPVSPEDEGADRRQRADGRGGADGREGADGSGDGFGDEGEEGVPSVRDVLWWLAADAWDVEHASRDLHRWLAQHGLEAGSAAARRRFGILLRQATALRDMLGVVDYQRLLDLHRSDAARQVAGPPNPALRSIW